MQQEWARMELFVVDRWRCKSRLFFLTHMHADHTEGLSSTWCRGPIYCSSVSAALLLTKFQGMDCSLVHPLEVGSTAVITVPEQDGEAELVEVTPIFANHCPGAVMYLFRGAFGCVLHTGDFRWEKSGDEGSKEGEKQLLAALSGGSVDRMYLDNTYCHPSFSFPPRHFAVQQVIQIIANHPEHDVVVGVDSLGKEELLLQISEAFNTKIWVWPERLQTMRLLKLPDVFTTDSTATRIRAVPRYSMSTTNLEMLNSAFGPTIGILPTGWLCLCAPSVQPNCRAGQAADSDALGVDRKNWRQCPCSVGPGGVVGGIHMIKYSLHCSFAELEMVVSMVKPKAALGIVTRPSALDKNPARHFGHLLAGDKTGHEENWKGARLAKCATSDTEWKIKTSPTTTVTKLPQTGRKMQNGVDSRLNRFCKPGRKARGTRLRPSMQDESAAAKSNICKSKACQEHE